MGAVPPIEKGSVVCSGNPFPLASYQKTKTQEISLSSILLTPSIVKQTEVIKTLNGNNVVQTDSTISIWQLKTDDVPSLIDSEAYRNGEKVRSFKLLERRQELGY